MQFCVLSCSLTKDVKIAVSDAACERHDMSLTIGIGLMALLNDRHSTLLEGYKAGKD